jgi:hypothetical protein
MCRVKALPCIHCRNPVPIDDVFHCSAISLGRGFAKCGVLYGECNACYAHNMKSYITDIEAHINASRTHDCGRVLSIHESNHEDWVKGLFKVAIYKSSFGDETCYVVLQKKEKSDEYWELFTGDCNDLGSVCDIFELRNFQ